MNKLLQYLILPKQVTEFEATYLRRMNRIGLLFFALHVPVMIAVAYFNGTGSLLAGLLSLLIFSGPAIAYLTFDHPRAMSLVYGFTAMLMGGLLVHVGQGPLQIEMHFYFFALLAMLAVYGNPLVILVAAVTVALHHLVLWLVLPASVFNYEAPVWVVAVHAAFVVLESVATCFIARSFFDNVIGLEKIVQARTSELDTRNQDMRLVLDNTEQGFVTIDRDGVMSNEKSAIVERWLGAAADKQTFADYIAETAPDAAMMFRMGWDQVIEDIMPLEVCLDQLPQRFSAGGRHYRLGCTPILVGDRLDKALLMISDITADVERERLEAEQREAMAIFERISRDKTGFVEFFDESEEQVAAIESDRIEDLVVLKRIVHTLKGNTMIFGVQTIADLCHRIETRMIEERARPTATQREELASGWARLRRGVHTLIGEGNEPGIEIDEHAYQSVLSAVTGNAPRTEIARMIAAWKLEPTARRLARVAEQAQGIARRLNKGTIAMRIEDHALRLEPTRWASFWSAFVHVVRNAIDHGVETTEDRSCAGKAEQATLELSTRVCEGELVIAIADDGRGIDWQAVADRARGKGIPHESASELEAALFEDGLSTAAVVNELSGRGIGMGAVRAACEQRGGTVKIHSRDGGGTRVEFRFPGEQMTMLRVA